VSTMAGLPEAVSSLATVGQLTVVPKLGPLDQVGHGRHDALTGQGHALAPVAAMEPAHADRDVVVPVPVEELNRGAVPEIDIASQRDEAAAMIVAANEITVIASAIEIREPSPAVSPAADSGATPGSISTEMLAGITPVDAPPAPAKKVGKKAPAKKAAAAKEVPAKKAPAKKAAPVKKAAAKTAPAGKKVTIAKKAPVPKVKEVVPEKATPFSTEATPA